jgi:two-component system, chemotaxis family, protein-glutamate methylesterase/glutaminase
MDSHRIIVVGTSMGGIQALQNLFREIPPEINAAMLVVMHVSPHHKSQLPAVLSQHSQIPAFHALDGARIERGKIYVAPPDNHLIIHNGTMRVVRGPRENWSRPAIDPLFRSAANSYGQRVIGVILTGNLDDGTAGAQAIRSQGGKVLVQDPDTAPYSSMPASVIQHVKPDHVASVQELARHIIRLVSEPVDDSRLSESNMIEKEIKADEFDIETIKSEDRLGKPSAFSCPECSGVLWEIQDGDLVRYRCRVGHAFSPDSMQQGQMEEIESALWLAVKTLQESITLSKKLMERASQRSLTSVAAHWEERIKTAEEKIEVLRRILMMSEPKVPTPN